MAKNTLLSAATTVLMAASIHAQTGIHPQSLGFGLSWVHDKDSVFSVVSRGSVRGTVHVNPATKEWRWLNTADYAFAPTGPMVMKNRLEGVAIYLSTLTPWHTSDGWKTVTEAKGAKDGIQQLALTDAGYVGHGNQNKRLMFSEDGLTWVASENGQTGSGAGTLRSFKNKVVVFSGTSFHMVSADGGKKFEIVTYDNSAFTNWNALLEFKMFSADSFLVLTDNKVYTSADGGMKWTAGNAIPANGSKALVRGPEEYVVFTKDNKFHFTKDAGVTWTIKGGPMDASLSGTPALIGDDLYVWPGYRSTDMGATWKPLFPAFFNLTSNIEIHSMDFRGDFGVVGGSKGRVAYTWDKGRSIVDHDTIPGGQDVMAVKILKDGRILAGDRNGQVFVTSDTGNTWSKRLTSAFTQNAIKFSASSDEKTLILSRSGQPAASVDGGLTWNFMPSMGGTLVQTVLPNGTMIGMANSEVSEIYAAKTRTPIDSLPLDQAPMDMAAATDEIGYILTRATTIGAQNVSVYKTTNGFKSSAEVSTIKDGIIGAARLQLLGADTLIVWSDAKPFHHVSLDGGKTWTKDSLDVHARHSAFPTLKRVYYHNANERVYALTGNALFLDIRATGAFTSGIKPRMTEAVAHRKDFFAAFDSKSGHILLRNAGHGLQEIGVFNVFGREALRKGGHAPHLPLDVSDLRKGVYFLRTVGPSGNPLVTRFVKG